MNYFVYWIPFAHDRLELIWSKHEDQRAVLRAASVIDKYLAEDPQRSDSIPIGEELTLIVEPLAVDYRVNEEERRVTITSVWLIGYLDRND